MAAAQRAAATDGLGPDPDPGLGPDPGPGAFRNDELLGCPYMFSLSRSTLPS